MNSSRSRGRHHDDAQADSNRFLIAPAAATMSAPTEKPMSKSRQLRDAAKKAEEYPNERGAKRAKCGTLLSTYLDREKGRSASFREEEEEEEEENASSLRVHAEVGSSARVTVVMEAVRREEEMERDGAHDACHSVHIVSC